MPRPTASWTPEMGARVETLRVERGLTQDDLAHLVGYNGNYLSKVLRAERGRKPSGTLRRKLADALGTSVAFLETGDESRKSIVRDKPAYPELELVKQGQEWRDAPDEVHAYLEGLANSGGDQLASEWLADLKKAVKDHRMGRPLAITRDALGRPAEEDVVDDPDER